MRVQVIPLLTDNYSFLLFGESGSVAMVDPADEEGSIEAIEESGGRLDYILNTHHHWDHAGSNLALKKRYACKIIGAKQDEKRIPGLDLGLIEGEIFEFDGEAARVLFTPGHTMGHICFWFEGCDILFAGDTLFSLGCGRLFEGDGEQMWQSLKKFLALPDVTEVYCAHEYTEQNGVFALSLENENQHLNQRMVDVRRLRQNGLPTIPMNLGTEKLANPFLRPSTSEIRLKLNMVDATDGEVFTEIRKRKDKF